MTPINTQHRMGFVVVVLINFLWAWPAGLLVFSVVGERVRVVSKRGEGTHNGLRYTGFISLVVLIGIP